MMKVSAVQWAAATYAFDPETSDLDMIVDPGPYSDDIADRYLVFAHGLEQILERSVDLITSKSIKNPIFRLAVDNQREALFEDGSREAAARNRRRRSIAPDALIKG